MGQEEDRNVMTTGYPSSWISEKTITCIFLFVHVLLFRIHYQHVGPTHTHPLFFMCVFSSLHFLFLRYHGVEEGMEREGRGQGLSTGLSFFAVHFGLCFCVNIGIFRDIM